MGAQYLRQVIRHLPYGAIPGAHRAGAKTTDVIAEDIH